MRYTEEQKKIFGDNVWARRQLLGMSKEDLANAYGCGVAMVNCWERGANVVPSDKMKELSRILKCSAHDLIRPYRIPQLSFSETSKVIEKKEEPVMCDADMIKAASEVFKNSYNSSEEFDNDEFYDDVSNIETIEEDICFHPVVDRVNKYLKDNNLSQQDLCRKIPMATSSMSRVVRGELRRNNPKYAEVERYLDSVEAETICKSEAETTEIIKEQTTTEQKAEEKGSISERMNHIYNTLFNALDELDKLKADIDKIEKVTAMLKEIQGL